MTIILRIKRKFILNTHDQKKIGLPLLFHSLVISADHPDLFDYVGLFSPGTPVNRVGRAASENIAVQLADHEYLAWPTL